MNANANIAGWLPEMARRHPGQLAYVLRDTSVSIIGWIKATLRSDVSKLGDPFRPVTLTFANTDADCNQIAGGLARLGIRSGMLAAVMIPPGGAFATYIFALFKLGAVPVLIDPGMGIRGVGACLANAAPEAFIGSTLAKWARRLFLWGRRTIRIKEEATELGSAVLDDDIARHLGAASPYEGLESRRDSDLAAILFTSGSTGPAKGAVYTHGMFQEQLRVLREVFGIEAGEVDLCTFPLFALFAPALGMTSIVPDMDPTRPAKADPKKLIKAIHEYQVTNLFGSPALIDGLSRYGEQHQIRLPSLRRVISAGAPVPATVIERMAKMLNTGMQVFTPYGATEALPIAVIGSDEILGETRHKTDQGAGICVGRPVGKIEVRVIPIEDGAVTSADSVAPGETGEICVRGPVVSRTYWNRPDADSLHKILCGDTVWHRTGDIGYFDEVDRLWFCGRKGHRVELVDQTLLTIPVEAVFNAHPDVFRTALVGVMKNGIKRPLLCVELEKHCRQRANDLMPELEAIRNRFPHTAAVRDFLFHNAFPVDIRHNAKINREKLAIWASRRLR